jgi:PRTRC genetic system protein C
MTRLFVIDGREFPDPNASWKTEDVRQYYAKWYPELANAETKHEKRGEDDIYTFNKRVGTKGSYPESDPPDKWEIRPLNENELKLFSIGVFKNGALLFPSNSQMKAEENLTYAKMGDELEKELVKLCDSIAGKYGMGTKEVSVLIPSIIKKNLFLNPRW